MTFSFVMSVRPSVRAYQRRSHRAALSDIWYGRRKKLKFGYNRTKISRSKRKVKGKIKVKGKSKGKGKGKGKVHLRTGHEGPEGE